LTEEQKGRIAAALPKLVLPEAIVPEFREVVDGPVEASPELLMKLGALPPTPLPGQEDEVVVDGSGMGAAIRTAANVAAQGAPGAPGVVPGTMVNTAQGQMFQPNPTTVTVVPPARSIQVVGGPEPLVADEELGLVARDELPSVLPTVTNAATMASPGSGSMAMGAPGPMGAPMAMGAPGPVQAGGYYQPQQPFQGQFYGPVSQMPMGTMGPMINPYSQNLNMGQYPAVYAAAQPQPAQLYTSGVPGAPPTIAVSTDNMQMGGFMSLNGPKPMRSNITLKRKSVSFGGSNDGQEESQSGGAPGVKVTVFKGS
jgi:hypothetical protein